MNFVIEYTKRCIEMWRPFVFCRMSLFSFPLKEIRNYDCVLLEKQYRMWGGDLEMWKLLDLYLNSLSV